MQRLEALLLVHARHMNELEKELRKQIELHEQAILELDSALRRSGVPLEGFGALSLRPESENPDRPSAGRGSTVST